VTGRPFQNISVVTHGPHVVEVVLDRPAALNAVSTGLARDLTAAMRLLADDPVVRAVVLASSQDRAFCVGADLKERDALSDEELRTQRPVTRAAYRIVLDLPMPAVAAVAGHALGGGMELALACDLVVADETAMFGLPEVSVGVIPAGGGTQLLTRRLGSSRAADLVFTARRFGAAEALRLGVADRVVPPGAARGEALALAETIAAHSPVAIRQAKHALRRGLDLDLAGGLELEDAGWHAAAFSPDRAEGVRAFVEGRAPRWPGPRP
jgi:enoyl-CoA hydratase/carnithine racemase